ncbi:MAG: hypothetical protein EOR89_19955, partial [Mesorhizobium sp.]
MEAEAVAARAQAVTSSTDALIANLKLQIEKLHRELYGARRAQSYSRRSKSSKTHPGFCGAVPSPFFSPHPPLSRVLAGPDAGFEVPRSKTSTASAAVCGGVG